MCADIEDKSGFFFESECSEKGVVKFTTALSLKKGCLPSLALYRLILIRYKEPKLQFGSFFGLRKKI